MTYTVGEMAKLLGIPASTLRYYDREGLLPFVERFSGGIRHFRDSDMEWLRVITCMKSAGMSLRDIREYIQLALRGDDTIEARLRLFLRQRAVLEERMEELRRTLETGLQVLVLRDRPGGGQHRRAPEPAGGPGAPSIPGHPPGAAQGPGARQGGALRLTPGQGRP